MSNEQSIITLTDTPATCFTENERAVVFPKRSQVALAWRDVKEGLEMWRIWFMLAYQDIKLRYRRSVLGPFWITISMAITVYSMGYLYAHLFHTSLAEYYPFLVAGMLSWSLISTIVMEITEGLMASESMIKQIHLPYSVYIHRIATRNILIFLHNIFVIIPIYILFHDNAHINLNTLFIVAGLFFVYLNTLSYGLLLSMIGARYRDIAQVMKNLVQVIFFITPVMWKPEILSDKNRWVVDYNPFYGFLECIRQPLLGNLPTYKQLASVLLVSMIGIVLSYKIFVRYRSRIVYWL